MPRRLILITLIATYFISCNTTKETGLDYPKTRQDTIIENYFGTDIAAPYRWLEDDNSDSTKAWVKAQNKVTFDYLATIPYREKINKRLTELWNYPKIGTPFKHGDKYFMYKNDGLQNQSILYVMDDISAEPTVLLNPNKLSEDGTIALTASGYSKDGKYLAYATSNAGSDWKEIFVMNIETKEILKDHIKNVKFSAPSWYKDGFYYTAYPAPEGGNDLSGSNEFAKIYFHKLGTAQSTDKLIYENTEHPTYGFNAVVSDDEKYTIIYTRGGASVNVMFSFINMEKQDEGIKPIITNFNNAYEVIDIIDDKFLVRTNKDAPKYKVVSIDPNFPASENWTIIIPESENVLSSVTTAGGKIFANYMKDVATQIEVYDLKGNKEGTVELPTVGNARGFEGKLEDQFVFYTFNSYTYPSTSFKYNIADKTSEVYYKPEIKFNPEDFETKQVFYKSKDGTNVPMFLTYKKGLELNGNNPTLLYAYGGFNISIKPRFSVSNIIFLENGGIYAVANIRGGSEYGEEWHKGGMRLNKQNVFDDFIAAGEYLISENYTSKKKLAISGRSNGGLLVGAVMCQRPDLFKVALPGVGVMDMLRFHKFTIGHAWIPEYGSSDDSIQFQNLYKFSPLHNLKEGTHYPATMVITADHDDRVVPAHSFKFAATLQAKHKGSNPVLIRIETNAGHGSGKPTSKKIEDAVDLWAFVFKNLDVTPIYK